MPDSGFQPRSLRCCTCWLGAEGTLSALLIYTANFSCFVAFNFPSSVAENPAFTSPSLVAACYMNDDGNGSRIHRVRLIAVPPRTTRPRPDWCLVTERFLLGLETASSSLSEPLFLVRDKSHIIWHHVPSSGWLPPSSTVVWDFWSRAQAATLKIKLISRPRKSSPPHPVTQLSIPLRLSVLGHPRHRHVPVYLVVSRPSFCVISFTFGCSVLTQPFPIIPRLLLD